MKMAGPCWTLVALATQLVACDSSKGGALPRPAEEQVAEVAEASAAPGAHETGAADEAPREEPAVPAAPTVRRKLQCPKTTEEYDSPRWRSTVKLDPIRSGEVSGVLLPTEAAVALLCQCSRGKEALAEEFWEPSAANVQEMEGKLASYLAGKMTGSQAIRESKHYTRQYMGIVRDGARRIYVNAFAGEEGEEWRFAPVNVCDGGRAYFAVEYDLAAGKFDRFEVNGSG